MSLSDPYTSWNGTPAPVAKEETQERGPTEQDPMGLSLYPFPLLGVYLPFVDGDLTYQSLYNRSWTYVPKLPVREAGVG